MEALLSERVVGALAGVVGRALVAVRYRCLNCEKGWFDDGKVPPYFGGSVELELTGAPPIEVGWDECGLWADHFSLRVREARHRDGRDESFSCIDVSVSAPWRNHVNATLWRTEVLGCNETPHVLILGFSTGEMVIADGSERRVGDGDDVIVCTGRDFRESDGAAEMSPMWRSSYPA